MGGLTLSFFPFFFSEKTSPTHSRPALVPPLPVTGHYCISLYLKCMLLETATGNQKMGSLILFYIKDDSMTLMRVISRSVCSLYH